ncbi:hypothetical protein GE09DRAFT_1056341 [Coniochaeta sp. 2T2.1]|nr:hypothetical protein GE09DRAFT_1056341 [Coniochaeta sp. 2T2.1]
MFLLDCLGSSAVVLLAAVASLPVTQGAPSPLLKPLEERAGCNADNLLRLLRATDRLSDSLPFCSSYIGLPASTVTVITVTPTATQAVTQTATGTAVFYTTPTVTVTVTTVSSETEIFNETPTETSVVTEVTTQTDVFSVTPSVTVTTQIINIGTSSFTETITVSTTTTKAYGAAKLRRGSAKQPLSDQVLSSYDPSRISSACACLTIPVNTMYVTATASAATSTSIVSSSTETSVTVTAAAATSTATESSSTRISLTVTAATVTVTSTVSLSTELSLTLTASTVTSITTTLSSSETSVTSTTTTTLTSVSTLPSPPSQYPAGFFVRSYRVEPDNFYMGNYYINRDASTTNKQQALTILGSNRTATRFDLTNEGYLKVLQSVAVGAAATGHEDDTYVAYRNSNTVSSQLLFDKIANVQACSTCTVLQFDMVTQSSKLTGQCKFLVLRNNPAPSVNFQVCGAVNGVTYYSLWQTTVNQISSSCFQMLLAVSKEEQSNCFGF